MNYLKLSPSRNVGNPFIKLMDKVLRNKNGLRITQVSESLYRGSDPSQNISVLSQAGIKTILNLKTIGKKELIKLTAQAKKLGVEYINIPLNPFSIKKSINSLINIIDKSSKENPLFVHCTFGRDRTGFVTALSRYLKEKMPLHEVILDMHKNGFRNVFFHMERYLKKFGKEHP